MSDDGEKKLRPFDPKIAMTWYYHTHGYSIGHIAWMTGLPVSEVSAIIKKIEKKGGKQ